jgi:aldehyde dehydrogenase (NAD+)
MDTRAIFGQLGLDDAAVVEDYFDGGDHAVTSPIDGAELARVTTSTPDEVDAMVAGSVEVQRAWRGLTPPQRGEVIRRFGDELRANKDALGALVTLETGKILEEGKGEVQEMIDICDFALGLSRQLYGLTIASERPGHRMMETWHPLGVVGCITAFNFPVAVWSWNFCIAAVCGNTMVWKPSEKTPLTAIACKRLLGRAAASCPFDVPGNLVQIVIGGQEQGERLVDHRDVALVSATGSTRMGFAVAPRVAARLGRYLLELGGNNAAIVTDTADLDLTVRGIVFAAVGTAGQRCTSLRRVIAHDRIYDDLLARLKSAYDSVPVGNPLERGTLVGPVIDGRAFQSMQAALSRAIDEGGHVFGGERVLESAYPGAYYTRPAIAEMPAQTGVVREETFAPILYAMHYSDFDQAIAMQNDVPQGLSSCVFTNNLREAETFMSDEGSDCGLANVNIGPSGAEIGGAFGGEKETGGGRESGSDAWRAYMRRATNTINFSTRLPLAQGISFDVG